MFCPRSRFLLALSIFAAAAVCAVAADQPPAPQDSKNAVQSPGKEPAKKPAPAASPQAAPAGGVVVFIDPATGKIRQPDASEIGGLVPPSTGPAPKAPEPVLIQGPGGAVGARLGADSLTYVVVSTAPDGKLAMDCVTGEKAAADRASASPAPTAASPAPQAKEASQGPAHAQDRGTRQAAAPAPQGPAHAQDTRDGKLPR